MRDRLFVSLMTLLTLITIFLLSFYYHLHSTLVYTSLVTAANMKEITLG